jgi:hypothetical protein
LRRPLPGWGPDRIRWQLGRDGVDPVPGRSSVYRALVRHGLVDASKRRRRREDYRRWERGGSMELWQMDVMGRVHLSDGRELKLVTGIHDHSRFRGLREAGGPSHGQTGVRGAAGGVAPLRHPGAAADRQREGVHGPVGVGPGPVMFDRICQDNGIRHLLTAPYSPTTTRKVERLHKTIRTEFLTEHDRRHASIGAAQAALDAWVVEYNTERPHQLVGGRPPVEGFALAQRGLVVADASVADQEEMLAPKSGPTTTASARHSSSWRTGARLPCPVATSAKQCGTQQRLNTLVKRPAKACCDGIAVGEVAAEIATTTAATTQPHSRVGNRSKAPTQSPAAGQRRAPVFTGSFSHTTN